MGRHIRALLIPSDGSPLHLVHLKTAHLEPSAPNSHLGHHPDFHKYWGLAGWPHRVATPMRITNQTLSCLNGKYYLFRCRLANAHLEENRHMMGGKGGKRCFGDAFIVRVVDDGGDERGDAAYEDVPRELVGTRLVLRMVGGEMGDGGGGGGGGVEMSGGIGEGEEEKERKTEAGKEKEKEAKN